MKFFDYADDTARMVDWLNRKQRSQPGGNKREKLTRAEVYNIVRNAKDAGTCAIRHCMWEEAWVAAGRPYYDLYPSLVKAFADFNLNVPPSSIKPPHGIRNLLVRLPDHPDNDLARTIFISWQPTKWGTGPAEPFIVAGADFGERDQEGFQVASVYAPPPDDSKTMQGWLDDLPYENQVKEDRVVSSVFRNDREALGRVVRVACCLCLLGDDADTVIPYVLNKDQDKAQAATPEALADLVARARANGKFGFAVGRGIESIPHTRRPHPALYHTGKGRTVPRIQFRKGCIVHRSKVVSVPTGFQGNDSAEG